MPRPLLLAVIVAQVFLTIALLALVIRLVAMIRAEGGSVGPSTLKRLLGRRRKD